MMKTNTRLTMVTVVLVAAAFHPSAGAQVTDDNPITKLKIVKTTNPDNVPPSCGSDWTRIETDLQTGGLVVGSKAFSEPAFYLCYKTGNKNDGHG